MTARNKPARGRPSRPDAKLTVVEASRWTLAPRLSLESLLAKGAVEADAVRALNGLASLVEELANNAAAPVEALDTAPTRELTRAIVEVGAVDEELVVRVLDWLKAADGLLRRIPRAEYHRALARLVEAAEARELAERLSETAESQYGSRSG